ncbi:hypothetical protein C7M84_019740 [Penaeus vannamei]|uniref:Uncharacterized protein n=1 Tax=Penaeus vannamei TaxID=6689 RepID=A0A3R7LYE3_PENVA|nr:hypothetical protein C7M84_019740 [Penaeus vannamei]
MCWLHAVPRRRPNLTLTLRHSLTPVSESDSWALHLSGTHSHFSSRERPPWPSTPQHSLTPSRERPELGPPPQALTHTLSESDPALALTPSTHSPPSRGSELQCPSHDRTQDSDQLGHTRHSGAWPPHTHSHPLRDSRLITLSDQQTLTGPVGHSPSVTNTLSESDPAWPSPSGTHSHPLRERPAWLTLALTSGTHSHLSDSDPAWPSHSGTHSHPLRERTQLGPPPQALHSHPLRERPSLALTLKALTHTSPRATHLALTLRTLTHRPLRQRPQLGPHLRHSLTPSPTATSLASPLRHSLTPSPRATQLGPHTQTLTHTLSESDPAWPSPSDTHSHPLRQRPSFTLITRTSLTRATQLTLRHSDTPPPRATSFRPLSSSPSANSLRADPSLAHETQLESDRVAKRVAVLFLSLAGD